MRFTVDREPMLEAVGRVLGAAGNGKTIPILGYLLVQATAEGVARLAATDLLVTATAELQATTDQAGEACLPAGLLHDVLKSAPEGAELGISRGADGRVTVQAGRSRFRLPSLEARDFPVPKQPGASALCGAVPAKDLARLLDKVSFSAGVGDGRPALNGVHLHVVDANGAAMLRAVATNGRSLAYCETACPEGLAALPPIIMPNRLVAEVRRLLGEAGGDATLVLDDQWLRAERVSAAVSASLLAYPYPEYARVIPTGHPHVLRADTGLLRAAIRRALIVSTAGEGSDKVKAVRTEFAAGEAKIAARSMDRGEAEEALEVEYDGDPVALSFNGPQLVDLLGQVDGPIVELVFGGDNEPVIVRDPAAPSQLSLTVSLKG